MASKKHTIFNLSIILVPWLSLLFLGKRNIKRFSVAGVFIIIFEIINHLYGHKKQWWKFYDKPRSFLRDELPFDIGPYMPMSLWILKHSYGNIKKYALINAIANGFFAFIGMPLLKKIRIVRLNRLNYIHFLYTYTIKHIYCMGYSIWLKKRKELKVYFINKVLKTILQQSYSFINGEWLFYLENRLSSKVILLGCLLFFSKLYSKRCLILF